MHIIACGGGGVGWGGVGMLTFGSNCTPVQRKLVYALHTNICIHEACCVAHTCFLARMRVSNPSVFFFKPNLRFYQSSMAMRG